MKHYSFLFFLFLFHSLQASNLDHLEAFPPMAVAEGCPSAVVGNVHVITGLYSDREVDLVIPGLHPLKYERSYLSLGLDWVDNTMGCLFFFGEEPVRKGGFRKQSVKWTCPEGDALVLTGTYPKSTRDPFTLTAKLEGITNTHKGFLSGKTHPKNTSVSGKFENMDCWVTQGSGERLCYKRNVTVEAYNDPDLYEIKNIFYPNGDGIEYTYFPEIGRVKKVSLSHGAFPMASFSLYHLDDKQFNQRLFLDVESCDGRHSYYRYKLMNEHRGVKFYAFLESVERPDGVNLFYQYQKLPYCNKAQMIYKGSPDGRFTRIAYFTPQEAGGDFGTRRVKQITEPAGPQGEEVTTYQFRYQPGRTEVWDAYGTKRTYVYDDQQRLTSIEHPDAVETLSWSPGGELLRRAFHGKESPLFEETYVYDGHGNVLEKNTFANFSGTSPQESQKITYTYHPQWNLKWTESNGKTTTHYGYEAGTDRLSVKYLVDHTNQIIKRTFYQYDETGAVSVEIEDDGTRLERDDLTGVTERHIRRLINRKTFPVGLPEIEDEYYLEEGGEKFLKRTHYSYSPHGKCTKQEIYDANGMPCYTREWQYDSKGHCIGEKDPVGHEIRRTFDENGNCIRTEDAIEICLFHYDKMNRLIKKEQIDENHHLTLTYLYDAQGNLTQETDYSGNITSYVYDEKGRNTEIHTPTGITYKVYNPLDQVVAITDPEGYTTRKGYNIRGQITDLFHPDGTEEHFRYTIEGTLKEKTTPTGLKVVYTYDDLNRPLSEECLTPEGASLSKTSHTYNAFHKLSTTDAEGYTIHYQYDKAGRCIAKEREGQQQTFVHDALGRVQKEQMWDHGQLVLTKHYKHDFLDRILEESVDGQSLKRFAYDAKGRLILEAKGEAETRTFYALTGQPRKIIDPEGSVIEYTYDPTFVNAAGEKGMLKTEKRPLGRITQTEYNSQHLPVRITKYQDTLLSEEFRSYDKKGQLIEVLYKVLAEGKEPRTYCTQWTYDSMGRIFSHTEGAKTTSFFYEKGQKKLCVKPDAMALLYKYDLFGNLTGIQSSDQTLDLHFAYDRLQRPVQAVDRIAKTSSEKRYDAFGHVIEEKLANGLVLRHAYDALGHLVQQQLPDGREVQWHFDQLHLKKVAFAGEEIVFHQYNLRGQPTYQTLPCGDVRCRYNLRGELLEKEDPLDHRLFSYDAEGNLLSKTLLKEHTTIDYLYDGLHQLVREGEHPYQYDSLYNRLSSGSTSYRLNNLNQIEEVDQETFTWDPNGNPRDHQKNGTLTRYSYDPLDRLIQVDTPRKRIRYLYDGWNRRLERIEEDKTWRGTLKASHLRFLVADQVEFGAYEADQLKELKVFAKTTTQDIGTTHFIELEGHLFIPLTDERGSITALLSPEGNLLERYQFDAFGNHEVLESTHSSEGQNPWRFQSKRWDPITQWVHFGHRDYNPTLGRWMTPDPAGYKDSYNLYQFLFNNPKYIDPDGRFVMLIPLFTMSFGTAATTFVLPSLMTVAKIAVTAVVVYKTSQVIDQLNDYYSSPKRAPDRSRLEKQKKKEKSEELEDPPYEFLPEDPSICPADGFEWRGGGEPGSKRGGWYNPHTQESLRPDFEIEEANWGKEKHAPHWDYLDGKTEKGKRIYFDNTWEPK